jgi:hypothetical protein
VSIAPSVIRKLVIAAAVAVVLVTISLGLAMHRGPSSPSVAEAAAVGTSGTVEPVTTSQYLDDDATADLAEVGCQMMGDHLPAGSSLGCHDATVNSALVASELTGDYAPTPSQYLDDDATADLGEVGCEMMGDHIPAGSSLGCDDER